VLKYSFLKQLDLPMIIKRIFHKLLVLFEFSIRICELCICIYCLFVFALELCNLEFYAFEF